MISRIFVATSLLVFLMTCCSASFQSGLPDLSALRKLIPTRNIAAPVPKRMMEFQEKIFTKIGSRDYASSKQSTSPNRYMMDLYREKRGGFTTAEDIVSARSVVTHRNKKKNGSKKITGKERTALRRSDIIRSFNAIDSYKIEETWYITFDLSTLLTNERVRLSELQLKVPDVFRGVNKIVVQHGFKAMPNKIAEIGSISTNTKRISSDKRMSAEITSIVRRWVRNGDKQEPRDEKIQSDDIEYVEDSMDACTLVIFSNNKNYGLVDVANERQERVRRASSIPGSSAFNYQDRQRRRRKKSHRQNKTEFEYYSKSQEFDETDMNSHTLGNELDESEVTKNDFSQSGKKNNDDKEDEVDQWKQEQRSKRPEQAAGRSSIPPPVHCRKVPFEVDFDKVGWGEWIIYPKRYQAFRCEGQCNVHTMHGHIPTNHAFMQGIYSSARPDLDIPLPCCVPTKLKPLSLLYFENGEVVQRDHENMVVEECGCR